MIQRIYKSIHYYIQMFLAFLELYLSSFKREDGKARGGIFVILLLSLLAACSGKNEQPNILFIVADDMNGYGFNNTNPMVISPNLDQFKENTISFPNTYCVALVCSPSRTAFLNGISPHKTGKYYNGRTAWDKAFLEK